MVRWTRMPHANGARRWLTFELSGRHRRGAARRIIDNESLAAPCRWRSALERRVRQHWRRHEHAHLHDEHLTGGEYCPGDHSVNARGRTKLMGVGQRIVRGAAHVGGVIVLGASARIRDVLVPVYARMGFAWDPASVGSIEDEIGAVPREAVIEALLAELAKRHDLARAPLAAGLLVAAENGEHEHRLG